MPGFEDPRYVEQQFRKLQKQVADLEKKALPFTVQQKGPLPGTMRAVAINDANTKSAMWQNFSLVGPGSGPYGAVSDSTGRIRFEWGSLAAYTDPHGVVSAADFGQRTIAADGSLISDSVGNPNLIKIPVSIIDNGGGTIAPAATGEQTVKSGSFTLSRTLPVFVIGLLNAYVSDSGGILALAANSYVKGDGSTAGPAGEVPIFINSGSGNPGSVTSPQALTLAANTYTAKLIWNSLANTQTLHWQSASLTVIQLGS